MSSFNVPLDIFGQNPRLSRLYTQLCFCFQLSDDATCVDDTIHHLERGLDKFSTKFPWVSGKVVRTDGRIFSIVPYNKTPPLFVSDKRNELPNFEEYKASGFPFKWLDEMDIASHSTLPDGRSELAPVVALQATFIVGGLLLVISAQHNCMDMAGQSEMIRLFAKVCSNTVPLTDHEIRIGNSEREHIIPLLEDLWTESKDQKTKIRQQPVGREETVVTTQSRSIWSYFLFSTVDSSAIKSVAEKTMHTEFISTDDALCAFIWKQFVGSVKKQAYSLPEYSTFERQVDVRKQLGLPKAYPGNAVYKTSTTLPIETVLSMPLGYLASELRASLSPTPDLGYKARKDATILHHKLQTENTETRSVTRGTIPPFDIKMSSWAKEECCNFDFGGPLGKPEAVRRPSFKSWPGLAYLMPKGRDGEIVAALCLNEIDTKNLAQDKEFLRFGRYVG